MIRFVNPNANAELTDWLRARIGQALGDAVPHSVEHLPDSVHTIRTPADATRAERCLADWLARQPEDDAAPLVVLASVDTGVEAAVRSGRRAFGFFGLVLADHARRGEPLRLLTVGAAMTASYRALVRAAHAEQTVAGIDTVDLPLDALDAPPGLDRLAERAAVIASGSAQPLWIVGVASLPAADAVRARVPAVIDPIRCMIRELRQQGAVECIQPANKTPTSCSRS